MAKQLRSLAVALMVFSTPLLTGHASNTTGQTLNAEQVFAKATRAFDEKDFQRAAELAKRTILLAEESYDMLLLQKASFLLGQSQVDLEEYQPALETLLKYLDIAPVKEDPELQAKAYVEIATIYTQYGDFEKALDYRLEAFEYFELSGNEWYVINSNYELGRLYFQLEQFKNAEKYFSQCYAIARDGENDHILYACLAALGSVHEKLGELDTSVRYNQQSLALADSIGYQLGVAFALQNIGTNKTKQKRYWSAEQDLRKALDLFQSLNFKNGQVSTMQYLSELYAEQDRAEEAIAVLEEGLVVAREVNHRQKISDFYKKLGLLYERVGNMSKSVDFLKKHTELKEILIDEKTLDDLANRSSRYELEKKEMEVKNLQEKSKREQEINRMYNLLSALIALFFLSMAILFFYWFRRQKQYSLKLSKVNATIQRQNRKLESLNRKIEQYAYVASHDLKEPIRTIGSFIELLDKRYQHVFDDRAQEFMHFITDAVSRMKRMLDDLLQYSRIDREEAPMEVVPSSEIIRYVEQSLRQKIEEKGAEMIVHEADLPEVVGNQTQLTRLFQNLISNAVKFSGKEKPIVEIGCTRQDDHLRFFIKDNGIGIPPEYQKKIFEMFTRLHSRKTYEGTGIGLASCKKIVDRHGGDIWVESTPGKGSTFFVKMPRRSGSNRVPDHTVPAESSAN